MQSDPVAALANLSTVAAANVAALKEVAAMSLAFYRRVRANPPWTGYLAIADVTNEAVGTCGFKGNPDAEGQVEIAYGTFANFEGRGIATAMARELTAIARWEPGAKRVVAHTLPERNASGRVLEKAGYEFVGEAVDPEDGRVWRWEHRLGG